RKQFDIRTAVGAEEGLKLLEAEGPFAVVVSDQRMPGMDGTRFLARVREVSPDTVRLMLTGQTDRDTAIHAVNEGSIFRFRTKPCPFEVMVQSLNAGLEQYRLVTAERELLDKTVKGSIKAMVDVLSLTHPMVFSRASRMRQNAARIVKALRLTDGWQYEI